MSTADETATSEPVTATEDESTVQFTYLKSNLFRVVHVDGVIGGAVHRNTIVMNVFSERKAIPQQQTFKLTAEGRLAGELEERRVERGGVVRELEASLSIPLHTAKSIRRWLDRQIKDVENAETPPAAQGGATGATE